MRRRTDIPRENMEKLRCVLVVSGSLPAPDGSLRPLAASTRGPFPHSTQMLTEQEMFQTMSSCVLSIRVGWGQCGLWPWLW